jgi:tetratricopeptide (TPR) repeat protein
MTTILEVPSNLAPKVLVYEDGLPMVINTAIQDCLNHWRHGNAEQAIRCAKQAQELAEAYDHHVSISMTSVLLADLYRELGQPGLALDYCQKAHNALRLQPNYPHMHHAEAVIAYLRGMLHHSLGANTTALSDYQRALTSFDKAIQHWGAAPTRDPTQANRCKKATRWIKALCRGLSGDLSPIQGEIEMHIPAANGQEYELARLKLATFMLPQEIIIKGKKYHPYQPGKGILFNKPPLVIRWNERHFVVPVLDNQWAGPYSEKGNYILVKRERKSDNPEGNGVLWDGGRQQWRYGEFTRDPKTRNIQFQPSPPPPTIIGGKDFEDEDIGIVRALLKPG